jgi:hypothetical protein
VDRAEFDDFPGQKQASYGGGTTGYRKQTSQLAVCPTRKGGGPRHGDRDVPASGSDDNIVWVDVDNHRDSAKLRFVGVRIGPDVAVKVV